MKAVLALLCLLSLQAFRLHADIVEPGHIDTDGPKTYVIDVCAIFFGAGDQSPGSAHLVAWVDAKGQRHDIKLEDFLDSRFCAETPIQALVLDNGQVLPLPEPIGKASVSLWDVATFRFTFTYVLIPEANDSLKYQVKIYSVEEAHEHGTNTVYDEPRIASYRKQLAFGRQYLDKKAAPVLPVGNNNGPQPPPNVLFIIASALAGLGLVAFVLRLRARRRILEI